MSRRVPALAATLLAAVLAAPLAAQGPASGAPAATAPAAGARPHTIDRSHSEINFTASSRLLDAHGTFDKWDAEVTLDPSALDQARIRLEIDAASINTRVQRRDDHVRSADFLDVAKYPTITFVSKSIRQTSATAGTIVGDLTMHGVTKELAVPVTMVFYENGQGRFRGSFSLSRKEWGVTGDSRLNPVADVVEVQFNMALRAPR